MDSFIFRYFNVNDKHAEQNNTLILTTWTKRTRSKDDTRRVRIVLGVEMLLGALSRNGALFYFQPNFLILL